MMGSGGTFFVGQQYGSATTTLTEANLPAHVHFYEADAAVPEPATWFMLILGFGLAGGVMRRRAGLARVFA
jgi:hypothetical protein